MFKYLKNDKGLSNTVGMLVSILLLLIIALVIFVFWRGVTMYNALDEFATELGRAVSLEGRCNGPDIDKRISELETTLGLHPTITITADEYYNASDKTVQYGDSITVTVETSGEFNFSAFDIAEIIPMKRTKIVQSMQYWKG